MEYMSGGSCYEIMRYNHPKGIGNESLIATILREVLKSLEYFHENRQLHRDVKAGNILINERGEVKIADFGIAANLVEQGQRKRARFTVIGTPCYMAPEILAAGIGYTEKADIWSLGITAIELATGSAPYANLYPLEVIVRISNSPPPTLPDNFSSAFRDFVRQCLQQTASKRASAHQLLESKFIKQATSTSEIARTLIATLPPLEERFQRVHQNTELQQNKQMQQQQQPDHQEQKAEKVEWIFTDSDQTQTDEESSEKEKNKPNTGSIKPEKSNFDPKDATPVRSTSIPNINKSSSKPASPQKPNEIKSVQSSGQLPIIGTKTVSEDENTKVVKKGKFTITKRNAASEADEQKIQMMETEVATLKHRIQAISNQNESIKKQIKLLEGEVQELAASSD